MLRVAEQFSHSDTGRQRRGNEDAFLERAPLFVVADGMGGAQAGEVASRIAIELFADGLNIDEAADPAERLAARAEEANAEIHARAQDDAELTGMGTTLTAAYVGPSEISIAHVGDSRAYRFHDGHLERLTHDHSLVEELIRQGQLTEAEAEEHPQRSIITRALGPEPDVDVDMVTLEGIDGDVYLLCSDGLTSMVQESEIERIVAKSRTLDAAGRELIAAANKAGGRDNITVILFRLEDLDGSPTGQPPAARRRSRAGAGPPTEPLVAPAAVATGVRDEMPGGPVAPQTLRDGYYTRPPRSPRGRRRIAPRMPVVGSTRSGRTRRRSRRFGAALAALAAVGVVALGLLLAAQAIYFIGADREGQVTIYNGLPFSMPFGINLYTEYFVSGVTTAELSPFERGRLFNNELRSQSGASSLVRALELDQVQGQ
jgi:serine/threonine protein phosphatase PrpC